MERESVGSSDEDLVATQIDGLAWLEEAPPFEPVVIDETGAPLRMITPDPRMFAAHKLWLSKQPSREAFKRRRDELQAKTVVFIFTSYLIHLPVDAAHLRMLPKEVAGAMEKLMSGIKTV